MPSVHLMKAREGGSGGREQWLESWVCKLEGLPPHILTFPSNAFLGSPGSVDHSERCSGLCRKLPIRKISLHLKSMWQAFQQGLAGVLEWKDRLGSVLGTNR